MDVTTLTGIAAACCTTAPYFPQLQKCWETEETNDLSLGMFLTLFAGIALWVVYGILRSDSVVLIANATEQGGQQYRQGNPSQGGQQNK